MPDQDLPPYRRIADDLRAAIAKGKLAPGEKLKSENELKDLYGTTRVTVRKALSLLKANGLLVSEQGRGVFVRAQPRVRLQTTGANFRARRSTGVSNYTAEASAQGLRAKQQILSVDKVPAPAEIAERLGLPTDTAVIVRRRAFSIDDEPMQLADGYCPYELFTGTPVEDLRRIKGGVSALIEDPAGPVGQRIIRFVEDLEIRMPTPSEVSALRIPPGVPLARVLRSAQVEDGRVVEVLDSRVPCDRHLFQYVIDLP
ncbi:GntR family transcriptional regulator [Streptomyces fulvoviolaceus]|uniref:GntR family transcriptional regulator n=1 Tax=Streptomyces fulvoviolaceus TaxID=285535 RepID=UPI0021BF2B31|nr:GntR family transcriptional regulator [Streptomyces fulvoviolaceus]MCT9082018.1 GntR family transcriptional regulator [Streptomyces fulvoviolaceus]